MENIENIKPHDRLRQWANDIKTSHIDDILEFLQDNGYLSLKGVKLRHDFWAKYIKEQ